MWGRHSEGLQDLGRYVNFRVGRDRATPAATQGLWFFSVSSNNGPKLVAFTDLDYI